METMNQKIEEAKQRLLEIRHLIDAFECEIPHVCSTIDWGPKKRGHGRRSGGTIKGSMSAAPVGIKKYWSVDLSEYMVEQYKHVITHMEQYEKARYYKARKYGESVEVSILYALNLNKNE